MKKTTQVAPHVEVSSILRVVVPLIFITHNGSAKKQLLEYQTNKKNHAHRTIAAAAAT